eukprot:scpid61164/ scgid3214/ Cytochrome P450 20A1
MLIIGLTILAIVLMVAYFIVRTRHPPPIADPQRRPVSPPPTRGPDEVPGAEPSDPSTGNAADIDAEGSLHQYVQRLHTDLGSPLVRFHLGTQRVFSVASPDLFRTLSRSFNRAAELFRLFEPLITEHSIQFANGSEGRSRHQLLRAPFQDRTLHRLYGVFVAVASEYVNAYGQVAHGRHGERVNISRDMFHIAMKSITRCAFGEFFANARELDELRENYNACWSEMEQRMDMRPPSEERIARFNTCRDAMYALVQRCIQERQDGTTPVDETIFIDRLLSMDRSQEETHGDAMTFLVGGFHTTGHLLSWAIYFLSINMAVQDQVAEEAQEFLGDDHVPTPQNISSLVVSRRVVDESLRCSVLAPWAARVFDEDIELNGYTIPAGSSIVIALGVVLNDPTIWPDPDRFDPDRFTPENVAARPARSFEPFGLSGRRCPGYQFAIAEVQIVISMLCRRFRFQLAGVDDIQKEYGLVTHPSRDIEITLTPR